MMMLSHLYTGADNSPEGESTRFAGHIRSGGRIALRLTERNTEQTPYPSRAPDRLRNMAAPEVYLIGIFHGRHFMQDIFAVTGTAGEA